MTEDHVGNFAIPRNISVRWLRKKQECERSKTSHETAAMFARFAVSFKEVNRFIKKPGLIV